MSTGAISTGNLGNLAAPSGSSGGFFRQLRQALQEFDSSTAAGNLNSARTTLAASSSTQTQKAAEGVVVKLLSSGTSSGDHSGGASSGAENSSTRGTTLRVFA